MWEWPYLLDSKNSVKFSLAHAMILYASICYLILIFFIYSVAVNCSFLLYAFSSYYTETLSIDNCDLQVIRMGNKYSWWQVLAAASMFMDASIGFGVHKYHSEELREFWPYI
jgi:hypothetical protein